MTEDAIKAQFGIDLNSGESLKVQLQEKLYRFVRTVPPGTRLPPERELVETLGISRVTVRNALVPLYEEGLLLRNSRNGTRVAPRSQPAAPQMGAFHQMALGTPWLDNPPVKLRFLLFENLPSQKLFWESVIDDFNQSQLECIIEPVWLPNNVSSSDMLDYLIKNPVDIFLFSNAFARELPQVAQALPQSLRNIKSDPQFLTELIEAVDCELFDYLVPLAFSDSSTFWNEELAEKCGLKDVAVRLQRGEQLQMIREVLPHLPEGCHAADHIWDYVAHQGLPDDGGNLDFLLPVLKDLAALRSAGPAFITEQKHPLEAVERFVAGQQLFLNSNITFLNMFPAPGFRWNYRPFTSLEGHYQMNGFVGIAISNSCADGSLAAKFIRHLMTDASQQKLADIRRIYPMRRQNFEKFVSIRFGFGKPEIRHYLETRRFFCYSDGHNETFLNFMVYQIRQELKKMMDGSYTPEKTLEVIRKKWKLKTLSR